MSSDNLDHIHLIGNSRENFYALGKRDKSAFEEVYQQITRLCIRNSIMAGVLKAASDFSTHFFNNATFDQVQDLKAYSEGLERPYHETILTMLIPEMVATFNKWSPDLLSLIPGCSSLFLWDEKNKGTIHNRILDYALSGPFEQNERSVLYELPKRYKVFSYGSAGFALPGLSAINEKGLSMALHYKHGNYFNLEGESIFAITSDILYYCSDIREALKYIRSKKSISFWGIYLADHSGQVISIDIQGPEIHQEQFDLKDHKYLYFNNRSLLQQSHHLEMQPYGNLNQCKMRQETVVKKMKNFSFTEDDLQHRSLELLCSPALKKANSAKEWKLPAITPSSIQSFNFHNSKFTSHFISGTAPKFYNGNYFLNENLFGKLQTTYKRKKNKTTAYLNGQREWAKYQSYLDKNQITQAFHSLQMATLYFKGFPEQYISRFYFAVMEYIYEGDKRDLNFIYSDFEKLADKLPAYLEDHRLLFLLRLSKILDQKAINNIGLIQNENLKKLYIKEFNLNSIAIRGLKFLIFPRIEIIDIIYAY